MNSIPNTKRGFTIVETLIAVFILVVSIAGPLVFASTALQSSYYAQDQITAFYLTQDVVETIKNIRDQNRFACTNANDWLTCSGGGIDLTPCMSGEYCAIEYLANDNEPQVSMCSGGTCPALNFQSGGSNPTYLYGYTSGSQWETSKYTRLIKITETVANKEAEIYVSIMWRTGIITRDFTVRRNIYNWPPL